MSSGFQFKKSMNESCNMNDDIQTSSISFSNLWDIKLKSYIKSDRKVQFYNELNGYLYKLSFFLYQIGKKLNLSFPHNLKKFTSFKVDKFFEK